MRTQEKSWRAFTLHLRKIYYKNGSKLPIVMYGNHYLLQFVIRSFLLKTWPLKKIPAYSKTTQSSPKEETFNITRNRSHSPSTEKSKVMNQIKTKLKTSSTRTKAVNGIKVWKKADAGDCEKYSKFVPLRHFKRLLSSLFHGNF